MPPPTRSQRSSSRVDHAELVGDLRTAEDRHERMRRAVEQASESTSTSAEQEQPRRRGSDRGRRRDRRVGAVRRAEGVVHVELAEPGSRDAAPGRPSSRPLEAQVLEQHDVAGLRGRDHRLDRGPHHPGASVTGEPSSSPRRLATGAIEYCGSTAPFGRPRSAPDHHHRTPLAQPLDGGQRGADAEVVGDPVAVEGDVEVDPREDPLPALQRRSSRPAGAAPRSSVTVVGRRGAPASADELHEVDEAVRVAPLVVVPAEHLDHLARGHGVRGREDARRRVADDVGRHELFLGVLEHAAVGRVPRPRPRTPR